MDANSAWTVIAAIAHNLGRWTTLIGLPDRPVQTARARRRQLLQIPARLTRTSRQWTHRMPARWPWQTDYRTVLDTIRQLPPAAEQRHPAARPPTKTSEPSPSTPTTAPARKRGTKRFPRAHQHPNHHQSPAQPHQKAFTRPKTAKPSHPPSESVTSG